VAGYSIVFEFINNVYIRFVLKGLWLLWFLLLAMVVPSVRMEAQSRMADSMRKKQEQFNAQQKLKAKRERDSLEIAKYKQKSEGVISYDSKGNKVEQKKNTDGSVTITTTIKKAPVLNRKFSIDTVNIDSIALKVVKSKNRLFVYHKGAILTAYKCVFGGNPAGQKLREGDRRTPEGIFTILESHKHDKWHTFMLFDYPNNESRKNHEEAKRKGLIPQDARIGGNVGIHGIWFNGDNVIELKHDWTDGCISLMNKDIEELNKLVKPGYTNLIIVK
jgi:lipoprotein-anchoring transpeptidase ErfK/SrfK